MDVAAGAGAEGLIPAELAAEVAMLGKENPPAPACSSIQYCVVDLFTCTCFNLML